MTDLFDLVTYFAVVRGESYVGLGVDVLQQLSKSLHIVRSFLQRTKFVFHETLQRRLHDADAFDLGSFDARPNLVQRILQRHPRVCLTQLRVANDLDGSIDGVAALR